jgi:glycine oxidase
MTFSQIRVVILGCGVVGAAIAYELSQFPHYQITVLEQASAPASGATGAALGVLMGVISHKIKGRAWQMRQQSLQRYGQWVGELEQATGLSIPFNRQGLVRLVLEGEDLTRWEMLAQVRSQQGYPLEIWPLQQLAARFPDLNLAGVTAAIASPADRQIDPTALTRALVQGAQQRGAVFRFNRAIAALPSTSKGIGGEIGHEIRGGIGGAMENRITQVITQEESLQADWLIVSAGMESPDLLQQLAPPKPPALELTPVLGQAVKLRCPGQIPTLHPRDPVLTFEDTHVVPLGSPGPEELDYWVGATVEFAPNSPAIAEAPALDLMLNRVYYRCPWLEQAQLVAQWSGLRPRPVGRPAPVIERLAGWQNVIVATGHYRNGVLLAPATAIQVHGLMQG